MVLYIFYLNPNSKSTCPRKKMYFIAPQCRREYERSRLTLLVLLQFGAGTEAGGTLLKANFL